MADGYDPADDITEKLQRAAGDARDVHEAWIAEICAAAKLEIERLREDIAELRLALWDVMKR